MSDSEHGYYDYLNRISSVVPTGVMLYLVGGAVRDLILNRPLHDYDFVLEGFVRQVAKRVADEFGGKYYVMDEDRDIARVIVQHRKRFIHFDFAKIVGESLEDDLRNRDFTVNAIAVDFRDRQSFIDLVGGIADLREKRLRMCMPDSLRKDPIRALRGLRFSLEYNLTLDDELLREMEAIPVFLANCSMERYRDELFKILNLGKTVSAIRLMERFAILDFLFPNDSPLTTDDLIDRMRGLEHLLTILTSDFHEDESSNLISGYAVLKLGAFRDALRDYFDEERNYLRARRSLARFTLLAGFYKVDPKTDPIAKILKFRSKRICLSAWEIETIAKAISAAEALASIFQAHNDGSFIGNEDVMIYRYFRKNDGSGIEGILLFLVQAYQKAVRESDSDEWMAAIDRVVPFLDARFNRYQSVIRPTPLLTGVEIIRLLNLDEGPQVGIYKEKLIEAQITGDIRNRDEAIAFLRFL